MKLLLLIISFTVLTAVKSSAQYLETQTVGTITVKKDPRVDILSAKQIEINKKAGRTGTRMVRGWRIQAANTQSRDEANAVKAEMLRRFPDQKAYLLYQSPNYRVRVGNFISQREGQQLLKMIRALYPQKGIYLVSDLVEYTPKEEEDTED